MDEDQILQDDNEKEQIKVPRGIGIGVDNLLLLSHELPVLFLSSIACCNADISIQNPGVVKGKRRKYSVIAFYTAICKCKSIVCM